MVAKKTATSNNNTYKYTASKYTGSGITAIFGYTFTPSDSNNYNTVDMTTIPYKDETDEKGNTVKVLNFATAVANKQTILLKEVATTGYSKAYGTIERALAAVSIDKETTVWVIPNTSGNVVIKSSVEIPLGVTLVLPYGQFTGTDDASVRNQPKNGDLYEATLMKETVDGVDLYTSVAQLSRKTLVKVAENVTITVAGTLEIAGELSGSNGGSDYAGHTARNYAELQLQAGAKIIIPKTNSSAKIRVLGFITEDSTGIANYSTKVGNGSQVVLESGVLYQPFTLRDFYGGTYMSKFTNYLGNPDWIGNYGLSPFNEFHFINVHPKVTINYGARMEAWANLVATALLEPQQNAAIANIIGSNDKYLIQLSYGSYMTSKYDNSTGVMDIDFYGGATLNKMELVINAFGEKKMSTEKVYFPLSWAYDISLNQTENQGSSGSIAEYVVNGKLQLLWGSELLVNTGTKLTLRNNGSITSALYVHEDYPGTYHSGATQVYGNETGGLSTTGRLDPALLIVRGTLETTNLAGKVVSDTDGATIIVNGSSSINMWRIGGTKDSPTPTEIGTKYSLLSTYNDSSSNVLQLADNARSKYFASDKKWKYVVRIDFETNGAEIESGNSYYEYISETVPSSSTVFQVPIPTLKGRGDQFTFNGWFVGSTQLAGPSVTSASWTFNGQYTVTTYAIYDFANVSGDKVDFINVILPDIGDSNISITIPAGYAYIKHVETDSNGNEIVTYVLNESTLTYQYDIQVNKYVLKNASETIAVQGDIVYLIVNTPITYRSMKQNQILSSDIASLKFTSTNMTATVSCPSGAIYSLNTISNPGELGNVSYTVSGTSGSIMTLPNVITLKKITFNSATADPSTFGTPSYTDYENNLTITYNSSGSVIVYASVAGGRRWSRGWSGAQENRTDTYYCYEINLNQIITTDGSSEAIIIASGSAVSIPATPSYGLFEYDYKYTETLSTVIHTFTEDAFDLVFSLSQVQ